MEFSGNALFLHLIGSTWKCNGDEQVQRSKTCVCVRMYVKRGFRRRMSELPLRIGHVMEMMDRRELYEEMDGGTDE